MFLKIGILKRIGWTETSENIVSTLYNYIIIIISNEL
jgi:hypothetical protein